MGTPLGTPLGTPRAVHVHGVATDTDGGPQREGIQRTPRRRHQRLSPVSRSHRHRRAPGWRPRRSRLAVRRVHQPHARRHALHDVPSVHVTHAQRLFVRGEAAKLRLGELVVVVYGQYASLARKGHDEVGI